MKQVWAAILMTQVAVVLLFVSVLVTAQNSPTPNDPSLTSVLPLKGEKGDTPTIDQTLISQSVQAAVDRLPPAKDGATAQVDYLLVQNIVKEEVAKIPKPKDGENAVSIVAKYPELRTNPFTDETEWRCPGDTGWTTLKSNPILAESCL